MCAWGKRIVEALPSEVEYRTPEEKADAEMARERVNSATLAVEAEKNAKERGWWAKKRAEIAARIASQVPVTGTEVHHGNLPRQSRATIKLLHSDWSDAQISDELDRISKFGSNQ